MPSMQRSVPRGWTLAAILLVSVPSALAAGAIQELPGAAELDFLVVGPDGRPVHGAEVRFAVEDESDVVLDPDAPHGRRQGLRLAHVPRTEDIDRLLREREPVSAVGGRLRVRRPLERGILVSARKDDLWGYRWVPGDPLDGCVELPEDPLRIELARDWDLRVDVVDERGAPAPLPVHLRCGNVVRGAAPDPSGALVFAHLGFDLRAATEPLVLRADVRFGDGEPVRLDPARPPRGPVRVRAPATGAVEVTVLGPDGNPAADVTRVSLRLLRAPGPAAARRFALSEPSVGAIARGGVARFERLALDRTFEVTMGERTLATLVGPAQAGATARVTVQPAPAEPRPAEPATASGPLPATASLSGRLQLPDGMPLTNAIELVLRGDPLAREPWTLVARLDADGSFRVDDLPPGRVELEVRPHAAQAMPESERPEVFRATLWLAPGEHHPSELACVDLRDRLFRHELALGDLRTLPEGARVFFRPAGVPLRSPMYRTFLELPLVLVSPWETIDVELFVPGHRAVSLRGAGARTEIALAPGLPVRLRLRTDGVLPAPPRFLKAMLVPVEDVPRARHGRDLFGPAFGATHELVTTAWRPGRSKIVWVAAEHRAGGASFDEVEVEPPQFVDVLDVPFEQSFVVELSAEELARVMRRLE
jgi:hypothetical protein